jgi:MoaA/NifB/PqqE/SkfB family radical SAM enzyme
MMSVAQVDAALDEGVRLGMKDVYFTGGEPFLHPELPRLVERALAVAPLTIVTNGILIDDASARWLRRAFHAARYSLDLRVSLDGMTPEQNDPVRGRGSFQKIVAGIGRLAEAGLSPVVTVVEHEESLTFSETRTRFTDFLRSLGLRQPRVKFLPLLRIGREARRTHGYSPSDVLAPADLQPAVEQSLLCSSGRCVSAQGAFTCPILVDTPDARLGDRLEDATRPIHLRWAACRTCVMEGLRCNT